MSSWKLDDGRTIPDFDWHIRLLLDNDQGIYYTILEMLEMLDRVAPEKHGEYWSEKEYVRFTFADQLKDFVEEIISLGEHDLFIDELLGCSIAAVDWQDIADMYVEDWSKYGDYHQGD